MSGHKSFLRKPVFAGNWKMFKTAAEVVAYIEKIKPLVEDSVHCEIVLAPPYTSLSAAVEAVKGTNIRVGAQNIHWENEGPFTGEVSGSMVVALGCTHVILGHSERRQYFGETDETVKKRVLSALRSGLTPIVCIGETLEDREQGRSETVLRRQFNGFMDALTVQTCSRIIVAYEPVWAIGTGRIATPGIVKEASSFLRALSANYFGQEMAERLRILYGGSVTPSNVQGFMANVGIDGALVGGASLSPKSMAAIVNCIQP